ncbi:MAG: phosphatidylserine/phosphatidylglycerophosphate/cardiolipin synthase family protein [Myxococcaceae bacterium]|nr:phosphatidylserine/phosphatidylglycerophosphate/cardiolipin synthase family protein [Myxococcaceae bacterium]
MKVQRQGSPQVAPTTGPTGPKAQTSVSASSLPTVGKGWAPGTSAPKSVGAGPTTPPPSGFRSHAFEARLDAETKSRATAGNTVSMLYDGVQSFAEREKMIAGAKHSICFQTFIFSSDETGWKLARQLADKAKQGVQVRVIYDALGSGRADPKMFDMMREAGVDVRAYGQKWKVWDLNDRWHEKNLIVDGQAAVLGGMNIGDEYALGGSGRMVLSRGGGKEGNGTEAWRDADVKLEGPAVRDSMKAFLRNWNEVGTPISEADRQKLFPPLVAKDGGPSVRVIQHNPEVKGLEQTATKLHVRAIETAQKKITIENAYFLPPPEIRKALIDAAKRGVDVRVMTNSREANDMGFVSDAARYFYDDLMKAGVKIYEKHGGTLHSKTATFDGEFSIVGSVNLNGRSKNTDAEIAMAVTDKKTAASLEERFAAGLKETSLVTPKELAKEGFFTNLKQWALSTLAWTF